MKTKAYLLICIISFLFYQCIEDDVRQSDLDNSFTIEQQSRPDLAIELDTMVIAESIQKEADPPKDKDPYTKRNGDGGE